MFATLSLLRQVFALVQTNSCPTLLPSSSGVSSRAQSLPFWFKVSGQGFMGGFVRFRFWGRVAALCMHVKVLSLRHSIAAVLPPSVPSAWKATSPNRRTPRTPMWPGIASALVRRRSRHKTPCAK